MAEYSLSRSETARDTRFLAASVVIAMLAIVAFRAAFSAYFLLDDFGMLAIARFLENPLTPFIHDQFPAGVYYRPLGMLVWWLSERMFGASPAAHYGLNLVLHGLVALVLGSFVKQLCRNRWAGLIAAACFLLHPIGMGTTLWLSDRFDLLALLFGLLGLRSGLQFSRDRSGRSLWSMLLFLGLSLLSKEIGLACFAGVAMLLLSGEDTGSLGRRLQYSLYLLLPAIVYLICRLLILDHSSVQSLLSNEDLGKLFRDGMSHWLAGWTDYFLFLARLDGWKKILASAAIANLALLVLMSTRKGWSTSRRQAILAGFAIWLSSGLLQWPLLGHFDVSLSSSDSAVNVVLDARYFYTSMAGFLIVLSALLTPLIVSNSSRRWLAATAMGLLIPWFSASQNLARAHRIGTQQIEVLVNSANAAIGNLDVPAHGCQFYLLDTDVWNFGWISDEAIKATVPDLDRIAGCLVQTEYTPWYHIAELDSFDLDKLRPMTLNMDVAKLSTGTRLGNAKILVLNLKPLSKIPEDTSAQFLSWQGREFVDVTEEVRSGRRKPKFVCNRSESECTR